MKNLKICVNKEKYYDEEVGKWKTSLVFAACENVDWIFQIHEIPEDPYFEK